MEQKRVPVTREGLERLKEELQHLIDVRRPEIVAQVAEARSHGDLRENSAYDAARHDQAMNEKRISDLEVLVSQAQVLDDMPVGNPDIVNLGSTATVDFDGDEEKYTIVGAIEAKPSKGLISNESPLGKALLGKRAGQDASFMTPAGQQKIKIKAVER